MTVSALTPSRSPRIRREYATIQRGVARFAPTAHSFDARVYAPDAVRIVRGAGLEEGATEPPKRTGSPAAQP